MQKKVVVPKVVVGKSQQTNTGRVTVKIAGETVSFSKPVSAEDIINLVKQRGGGKFVVVDSTGKELSPDNFPITEGEIIVVMKHVAAST